MVFLRRVEEDVWAACDECVIGRPVLLDAGDPPLPRVADVQADVRRLLLEPEAGLLD